MRVSLVAVSTELLLASVHRLLCVEASLVAEQRLFAPRLQKLWCTGLVCPTVFLVQGLNLCPLHWLADSQPLYHICWEAEKLYQSFKGCPLPPSLLFQLYSSP